MLSQSARGDCLEVLCVRWFCLVAIEAWVKHVSVKLSETVSPSHEHLSLLVISAKQRLYIFYAFWMALTDTHIQTPSQMSASVNLFLGTR